MGAGDERGSVDGGSDSSAVARRWAPAALAAAPER